MTTAKEDAFNRIFISHHAKMQSFARKLCRNSEEAEDIAQEAMIKAYNAFDQCTDRDRLDNWLMRIVYNTFLDYKRKERRRIKEVQSGYFSDDFSIENLPDNQKSPVAILMDRAISPEFLEAFAGMDSRSRELFRLAYIEGMDHVEIGKQLGIKPGCSRSRAHRLCLQVRRTIKRKFPKSDLAKTATNAFGPNA